MRDKSKVHVGLSFNLAVSLTLAQTLKRALGALVPIVSEWLVFIAVAIALARQFGDSRIGEFDNFWTSLVSNDHAQAQTILIVAVAAAAAIFASKLVALLWRSNSERRILLRDVEEDRARIVRALAHPTDVFATR